MQGLTLRRQPFLPDLRPSGRVDARQRYKDQPPLTPEAAMLLVAASWIVIVLRVGYLAGLVAFSVAAFSSFVAFSAALGEWYGFAPLVLLIGYVALASFGLWVALAGRQMFGNIGGTDAPR